MMTSKHGRAQVGYLLKTYPKVSETFILQEILTLEQQGMALHIFALHPPQEHIVHTATHAVRAQVTYLPQRRARLRRLRAHVAVCWRRPWRYCRALAFAWRRQETQRFEEFCQAGALAWSIMQTEVTHLHAHFANAPAGVAELVHLLLGIPYSITAHAKDIYLSAPAVLDRKMQRASFVVTCTGYNQDFLHNLSTSQTPIHRIYHGLDLQRFCPDPAVRAAAAQGLPTILSVGRLREKKGFGTLLWACHALQAKGYPFRCQIVGYGPLQADMEQQIDRLELHGTVTLLGRLPQEAVITLYNQATLFVLPCQISEDGDRDGIPNVLMEAMAMQLPVVSTTVSGIPELVEHRRHGLLVPPQDVEALAQAMALLLDQPRLRAQFGQAGREKVCQEFSSQGNIAHIHALLSQTLQRDDLWR